MSNPTVAEVVTRHLNDSDSEPARDALVADLIEREDLIADQLRVAGSQLGTFPELVAKVLADVGLGTPVSEEQMVYLNQQFTARVAWLQEQFRQHGGQ